MLGHFVIAKNSLPPASAILSIQVKDTWEVPISNCILIGHVSRCHLYRDSRETIPPSQQLHKHAAAISLRDGQTGAAH